VIASQSRVGLVTITNFTHIDATLVRQEASERDSIWQFVAFAA
jgi:hypothetical protein